jgi:hypothetical protein
MHITFCNLYLISMNNILNCQKKKRRRSGSASFSNERYTSGWRRIPFYPKGPNRAGPSPDRQRQTANGRESLGANPDDTSNTTHKAQARLAPHSRSTADGRLVGVPAWAGRPAGLHHHICHCHAPMRFLFLPPFESSFSFITK